MEYNIIEGDCLNVLAGLPAEQFQTCITSPPYLGLRDYGVADQIGLERTPEEYTARLVEVFRAVHRVLRDDGTLWLNLGDSYASGEIGRKDGGGPGRTFGKVQKPRADRRLRQQTGLGPKQLLGIPWRVAFALQADGWILRADVVWEKPNAMCESVRDRPTKSHEYLFLIAKQARYFYDSDAIREPNQNQGVWGGSRTCKIADPMARGKHGKSSLIGQPRSYEERQKYLSGGRNRRSVWNIPTRSFKGAHFAVFPPALVEPCVLAGTSEAGCCPRCGAAWRRVVERSPTHRRPNRVGYSWSDHRDRADATHERRPNGADVARHRAMNPVQDLGWQPSCTCEHTAGEPCAEISINEGSSMRVNAPVPCTVLDPFCGAGTTGMVALRHGRRFVGVELNPAYVALARARLDKAAADRPLLALT